MQIFSILSCQLGRIQTLRTVLREAIKIDFPFLSETCPEQGVWGVLEVDLSLWKQHQNIGMSALHGAMYNHFFSMLLYENWIIKEIVSSRSGGGVGCCLQSGIAKNIKFQKMRGGVKCSIRNFKKIQKIGGGQRYLDRFRIEMDIFFYVIPYCESHF